MLPPVPAVAATLLALAAVSGPQGQTVTSAQAPLDPQRVQDQQDMTWADYRPIPGTSWADPARTPERVLRVALVAIDFEDQPFVITLPKHSDPFGNPQIDPVRRQDVPRFHADFLGKPGADEGAVSAGSPSSHAGEPRRCSRANVHAIRNCSVTASIS